ncbi:hypothetical protein BP00DRAFT_82941 [Aspergillus indologenus CBS 114.80]|uniref:Uncharacterized protein n=1 Tax=Aspergillus indologenus CBS 114.80 TaxID=1450541 RepID=A0A2V5IDF2_9EURO|nr:hypothetical protein BP00DRAFT_82941 [Aspergillus indologenus CBS 114.80]
MQRGYLEWSLLSDNNCVLAATKKNRAQRVYIGVSQPATCRISADFAKWTGFGHLPASSGNYLSILALGWSYILATRLVELRQRTIHDRIFYTGNWALPEAPDDSRSCFSLDLNGCDPAEAQWWAAILAPGNGWQAILERGGKSYYPPWECHVSDPSLFRFKHDAPLFFSTDVLPPSPDEAQIFLYKLARRYNCFDQLLAAFTTALTFPGHARFGYYITLPLPLQSPGKLFQDLEPIYMGKLPRPDEIAHFLCLSGTLNFVTSCLGSCLWDENTPSNLASEWLNPLLEETIPCLSQEEKSNVILHSMARRRPKVASLCLGAAISGLLCHVARMSQSHILPVSLEANAWTGSPQSFMDPENHRRVPIYTHNGRVMIPREDELRLLYLTDVESLTYGPPPLSPYLPFGVVTLDECALDVRLHASCCHRLSYLSWSWITRARQAARDDGLLSSEIIDLGPQPAKTKSWLITRLAEAIRKLSSLLLRLPPIIYLGFRDSIRRHTANNYHRNEDLSLQATRKIFHWTLLAEGTKAEDRELWKHDWLQSLRERMSIVSWSSSSSGNRWGQSNDFIVDWQEDIETAVHP